MIVQMIDGHFNIFHSGLTSRNSPLPLPSWYLPGVFTDFTKAAVSDLGFSAGSVGKPVPPIVPPKFAGTPRNNQDQSGTAPDNI